jgi:serine/threonine-protein kinase HipA
LGKNNKIYVYADWIGLAGPQLMGVLSAVSTRGREIFSFAYDKTWLQNGHAQQLDPDLGLFGGPQYSQDERDNFGIFLDSAPDRWGRVLMERREAQMAREEVRRPKTLLETDYLLGVHDLHRMGAIRFKNEHDGPFLHADAAMATPPFTKIRTLEEASLQLERDGAETRKDFAVWIDLLLSPGSSLGGARPKASVIDPKGHLWIAKFPSARDGMDTGGWEAVVNVLASKAGLRVAEGNARRFTQDHHTYLTKRFDRLGTQRIHFASAMTLLGKTDGKAGHTEKVSYLDIAEFIMRQGLQPKKDLEELWRRIVFNICVSNSDDHLRNHGFLLEQKGWILSPAYDINPVPHSRGLHLNINETSNALDLEICREVAEQFRLKQKEAETIIEKVKESVSHWHEIARKLGISRSEIVQMEGAFNQKIG